MERNVAPRPAWIGLRPPPGVLVLLTAITSLFVIDAALGHPAFVRDHLALHPRRALGREPWQLLTTAFVHLRFGALFSTGVTLWFFGSPVEHRLGRARLFGLLALGTLAGSLASALLALRWSPEVVLTGAGPASLAALAAFGVLYGPTPVALFGVQQLKASSVALVFIGITVAMYLMNAELLPLAGALAGAATGALFALTTRTGDLWSALRVRRQRFQRWRLRRRYKVLPGGRDRRSYLH
jgi:membrane associated rhomboid family serine protease